MSVRIASRADGPGVTIGLLGTLVVHAGAVLFVMTAVNAAKPSPPVYAVELVAAPAPAPKQRLATEAATPAPPPEPAPAPPKTVEPKTKAAPVAKPRPKNVKPPEDAERERAPKTSNAAVPLPGETPSTGTDVANVKTPGLAFPYPEYLRNIMNEVLRRWERPRGALRAEVRFLIMRDGTVRDIAFEQRSGNFSFDLSAQGAIEAAGNAHAFGPLPDGWEADVLPIVFIFEPAR